ncbi:MAG: tRNA (N6-threonylcarbamoyladenosine(37)-N6)-methyltransferase TrmO [Gammaproteobacteria bacterium]|nr:tRNA (N6-threonylcarbamoyladenosine(37)-N6)-methyltransferase TrmO [Gammaproteobacteria bacterium]
MESFKFNTIGIVHSCFKEKFTIPRQSGLVTSATATIELLAPYNHLDTVKGLEQVSHLWISFIFHQHLNKTFKNRVSPPRLNGEKKGVYATRSPFRPNPLGLSVVKLEKIKMDNEGILLEVSGGDFLDKTPIVDIKPYISYADKIEDAIDPFSEIYMPQFEISFSDRVLLKIDKIERTIPNIKIFIEQLLTQDPRPNYTKKIKSEYRAKIYDYDLIWHIDGQNILVLDLLAVKD